MDWVVSYDYPIDNKEEMKMEKIRVGDMCFDDVEVRTYTDREGTTVVTLDLDPNDYGDGQTLMQYSPDQARKLAAALILAADEAELPVGKDKMVKADFSVADELTKNSKFL